MMIPQPLFQDRGEPSDGVCLAEQQGRRGHTAQGAWNKRTESTSSLRYRLDHLSLPGTNTDYDYFY